MREIRAAGAAPPARAISPNRPSAGPAAPISGLIGWGLWNLKNWARITAIVFAVLGMLGGATGLMWALMHFNPVLLTGAIVRAGIAALIFWYLNQPHVKTAFGATQASVASA